MNKVDIWSIYDNSIQPKERIAFGGNSIRTRISNEIKFRKIRSYVK